MAGAVQFIDILRPISRQQGAVIPNLLPASRWQDAVSLAALTAATYTLPTDSLGNVGRILSISCTGGPLYYNFAGTALVQGSTVTNGTASGMLRTDSGGSYLLGAPQGAVSVSLITTAATVVSIEVWR